MTFLSFMAVDVEGNVNVSKLGRKPYLTAGCGGFVDITAHAKKIVFSGWFEAGAEIALDAKGLRVVKPGQFTKMVERVEHVTFSGARALAQGQEVAKYMLHAAVGEDRAAMIEALGSGMTAASADKAEGVAAFRAKRKPQFKGE